MNPGLPNGHAAAECSPALVRDFLECTAAEAASKTALVCGHRRLSYGEVDALANRFANGLLDRGIQRGDRVAICLRNGVEAVIALFGTWKAGAVAVPINAGTKREKLAYIVNNCGARALVMHANSADVLAKTPGVAVMVTTERVPNCALFAEVLADVTQPSRANIDLDLALLIYTSGTTGEPKGVMSDHGNVVFASGSIIRYLGCVSDDVMINVLPLSFDYGLYQLLMAFRVGATFVLEESFAFPGALLARISAEQVTALPLVPTLAAMLLQMDLDATQLRSLRYITNTAAALPASHLEQLRRVLPHVRLFSMYGLTETKRTLYLPPEWISRKPGSVGIPIPGTEAWLEDEAGRRLGPDHVGELIVRGRHVMRGYWGDPDLSARRFPPGPIAGERVCRTGDLFRMDADGCFYFVGRKDDIIKTRGEKVAPREVEEALYALEGVVEAAVFGVPDPILGHAIKAVIATDGRCLTAAQVIAHCRCRLEEFMVPRHVEFCATLPKSPSGKIQKRTLACAESPAPAN